jgi:hypothetical protein
MGVDWAAGISHLQAASLETSVVSGALDRQWEGSGNQPAVLAHLPCALSCLLHNRAAVSNSQMSEPSAHSPCAVAFAGTHQWGQTPLFYLFSFRKGHQNSMSGNEPNWTNVECRNIPSPFCAQNYFCFLRYTT